VALALACAGGYALILLGTAIAIPNKTLPMGSWKYFCEANCHIAYSRLAADTPDPRHAFLVDANKHGFLPVQLKPGNLLDS
jgi:hypothetical protein